MTSSHSSVTVSRTLLEVVSTTDQAQSSSSKTRVFSSVELCAPRLTDEIRASAAASDAWTLARTRTEDVSAR